MIIKRGKSEVSMYNSSLPGCVESRVGWPNIVSNLDNEIELRSNLTVATAQICFVPQTVLRLLEYVFFNQINNQFNDAFQLGIYVQQE